MSYALLTEPNAEVIMKSLIVTCFALLVVGCQIPHNTPRPIVYQGGDGSSCEQAIVIRDVPYREVGALAERLWLAKNYPGYCRATQSGLSLTNRHYDVVEFATAEGETRKVYFDATEFAHK
jgi:hypothetical protein